MSGSLVFLIYYIFCGALVRPQQGRMFIAYWFLEMYGPEAAERILKCPAFLFLAEYSCTLAILNLVDEYPRYFRISILFIIALR